MIGSASDEGPPLKRFVLLYHGYRTSRTERDDAWNEWVRRRAASFADLGSRFGCGRRITNDTTVELSLASNAASGYSIVRAKHMDAAEQLLEGCPIADGVSLTHNRAPDPEQWADVVAALKRTAA